MASGIQCRLQKLSDTGPFKAARGRTSPSKRRPVRTRAAASAGRRVPSAGKGHKKASALVVGAGPTGLATALMLAKRGWQDVVVVEKRGDVESFDPALAYLYAIDGRGQKFTDLMGLTDELTQVGVHAQSFDRMITWPDGKRKIMKPFASVTKRRDVYLIPRHTLLSLLYREVVTNWSHRISLTFGVASVEITRDDDALAIQVHVCKNPATVTSKPSSMKSADQSKGGSSDTGSNDGSTEDEVATYEPSLIIGCDGLNSVVRNTVAAWEPPDSTRFRMHLMPSPSTGLRFKVMRVTPTFAIFKDGGGHPSPGDAPLDMFTLNQGAYRGRMQDLALTTMAPPKDPRELRTGVITTLPENVLWEIEEEAEMRAHLQRAFPQLSLDVLVTEEELARFTRSKGGYFPAPQYCQGMQVVLPSPSVTRPMVPDSSQPAAASQHFATSGAMGMSAGGPDVEDGAASATSRGMGVTSTPAGGTVPRSNDAAIVDAGTDGPPGSNRGHGGPKRVGVVLLGDALHSFPPDLAAGVNSGLEDVVVLNEVLSETEDDVGRALPLFEERRMPDVKALVRLVQISNPWQYRQNKLRHWLWSIKFMIQVALSQWLPFLFEPPVVKVIQDEKLRYRDILAMQERNVVKYQVVLLGMLAASLALVLTRR